ncbi:MAG: YggS family pyridoxal phosphate-dependent enzyme [Acidobacteriota bacterium]
MSQPAVTGAGALLTVAQRLARVRERLERACRQANRRPEDVTLVAVSKRQPLGSIRQAADCGQTVFGENQLQEAESKISELPDLEWHMIGPLQSNKVKRAAGLFSAVHSLDRPKVARLLDREAVALGRSIEVFVQINVGLEESKHGFLPDRLDQDVRPLAELEGLKLVGLMAIPPFARDPEDARPALGAMRRLRDRVARWPEWKDFRGDLSMGMSHDLEVAISEGATHVRVGTDVFGPRPS